jgi:hypothetical protein
MDGLSLQTLLYPLYTLRGSFEFQIISVEISDLICAALDYFVKRYNLKHTESIFHKKNLDSVFK